MNEPALRPAQTVRIYDDEYETHVTSVGAFDIYRIADELSNGTGKVLQFEVRERGRESIIKTLGRRLGLCPTVSLTTNEWLRQDID